MNLNHDEGAILKFVNGLSINTICKTSMYAIIIWILSPFAAMVMNVIDVEPYDFYSIWILFLYLAGGIGWASGLSFLYKIITESQLKRNEILQSLLPIFILFAFGLWCAFCTLFAEEKRMAIFGYVALKDNLITYFFYAGMIFAGISIAEKSEYLIIAAKVFVSVATILCVIALMNNQITALLCKNETTTSNGYESVFYNTNHFGYYLVLAIMICGYILINCSILHKRVLYCLIYSTMIITLILNNSMGAYIAVGLSLVLNIIWLLMNKDAEGKKVLFLLVLFTLLSVASLIFTSNVRDNFVSLFNDGVVLIENETEAISAVGSNRGRLWKMAFRQICSKPIVGLGPQNYFYSSHNMFLQLGIYYGIPGLLLYLSLYFAGAIRLFNIRKVSNIIIKPSAFVVVAFLISGFFGVTMFYTSPYFYVVLGVCFYWCMTPLLKIE